MNEDTEARPVFCTDEHLRYLDALRESAVTNMFGARPYLMNAFPITKEQASAILMYWMHSFEERHKVNQ